LNIRIKSIVQNSQTTSLNFRSSKGNLLECIFTFQQNLLQFGHSAVVYTASAHLLIIVLKLKLDKNTGNSV